MNKPIKYCPSPFFFKAKGKNHVKNYSIPATKEDNHTLRLFCSGSYQLTYEHEQIEIESPLVGLFKKGFKGVIIGKKSTRLNSYYLRFKGDYADYLVNKIIQEQGSYLFVPERFSELASIFRQQGSQKVYREESDNHVLDESDLLVPQALSLLLKKSHSADNACTGLNAQKLKNYLSEHLHEPTDLTKIAQDLAVSKTTLVRKAKECCGETVLQLHEAMKISWAKELLQMQVLPVHEVARHVGYEDPFYFSRVFRKCTGKSPKVWQQENQFPL